MLVAAPDIVLVFSTTGYEGRDFLAAATRLGVSVRRASDRCHVLEDPWGDDAIPLRFEDPEGAAKELVACFRRAPPRAFVPVGDKATVICALAASGIAVGSFGPADAIRSTGLRAGPAASGASPAPPSDHASVIDMRRLRGS